MKRTLTVGRRGFPIYGWRQRISEAGNLWHQCTAPLSVVGDVWEIKVSHLEDKSDVGLFLWAVRTMTDSRPDKAGEGPRGYAATLEAAKAIVECVLVNTGTCNPKLTPEECTAEVERVRQRHTPGESQGNTAALNPTK